MAVRNTLSIILTAHNCDTYLGNTLASLENSLEGLTEGYEIILISDASIDRTVEMLNQFAHRNSLARVYQVDFRNIGKVRNFGVQQCTGDYITMVDGDDQLLPSSLRDITQYLHNSQPDLLLTKLNEVYNDKVQNITWSGLQPQHLSQHQAIKKFLIHKEMQAHFIGQFVKREQLLAHPFPEFQCYEDAYLFPTILSQNQNIVFSPHGPYLYFKRGNSLSSQIDEQKVHLLVEATDEMDRVFGNRYSNLIACHWITIFLRYGKSMQNVLNRQKVVLRIKSIHPLSFLFDPAIRLSFKKKYLKVKNGK